MDSVYVKFTDGSLCKIAEATLDDLEPVQETPLLDDTHAFYPGQTVTQQVLHYIYKYCSARQLTS